LPFKTPVIDVDKVIAGVVVALATVPAKPLAETTETLVTVPAPEGEAHTPSPRQKVDALADVPEFRLVTGRLPVTPVDKGSPVAFVNVALEGVPKAGVTKVGDVAKTKEPVPVSSVTAEIRFALDGVARNVATPVPRPERPVLIGKPVALVKVPLEGVPRAGVTKVGLLANTKAPDPVSSVTADAKFADDGVPKNVATPVPKPLTPVEMGNPVAFVKVPEAGVPNAGVTNVGEFDNTTLPVPVAVVTPVPPLRTGRVPVMSEVERLTASHVALVPSV
jgi:hypothetical protein